MFVKSICGHHILCIPYEKSMDTIDKKWIEYANQYEGNIKGRIGLNFPYSESYGSYQIKYVIVYPKNDHLTYTHEWCHAMYYLCPDYRKKYEKEWDLLDQKEKQKIISFMKKIGYPKDKWIDEYQAYRQTEKRKIW